MKLAESDRPGRESFFSSKKKKKCGFAGKCVLRLFSFLVKSREYPYIRRDKTLPVLSENISTDKQPLERTFTCQLLFRNKSLKSILEIFSDDQIKRFNEKFFGNDYLKALAMHSYTSIKNYNEMDAESQKLHDIKKRLKFLVIAICLFSIMIATSISAYNPQGHTYAEALSQYSNQNYSAAADSFYRCGKYENANAYSRFCLGMSAMKKGKYKEAQQTFASLKPLQSLFSESLEDLTSDCYCGEAEQLIAQKKFVEADKLLRQFVPTYKKVSPIQKKLYKLMGDDFFSKKDIKQAVTFYNLASKLGDSESEKQYKEISEDTYAEAQKDYSLNLFDAAANAFSNIESYKDSVFMEKQCIYRQAFIQFTDKDYSHACQTFSKITDFKDSASMANECIYRNAQSLSNYEKASQLWKISDFRDSDAILSKPQYVLYGKWQIQTGSESSVIGQTFSFAGDMKFQSSVPLPGISSSAYSYDAAKICFDADNQKSRIIISVKDSSHILITGSTGEGKNLKSVSFDCFRTDTTVTNTSDDT